MEKKTSSKPRETDLYQPVADFLAQKGFHVRSEVRGCDVTAVREDTLVVVELKLRFNLKLLMQAVNRLTLTDYVYVAIPRPSLGDKNGVDSHFWRDMLQILKRLELGLLVVALDSPVQTVEPVLHPMRYTVRKSHVNRLKVIQEIDSRVGDFNTGGSSRTKITTAYREKSIQMACIMKQRGPTSTRELRLFGLTPRETMSLGKNFYGWFERVSTGVYQLSPQGLAAIETPDAQFAEIVAYYLEYARKMVQQQ